MISLADWLLALVHLLTRIAILSAVLRHCRRRSTGQPRTAKLLIRAVACQFCELILFVLVNCWYFYLFLIDVPMTAALAQPFGFQFIGYLHQALDIASWSLIARAILMRPNERREQ